MSPAFTLSSMHTSICTDLCLLKWKRELTCSYILRHALMRLQKLLLRLTAEPSQTQPIYCLVRKPDFDSGDGCHPGGTFYCSSIAHETFQSCFISVLTLSLMFHLKLKIKIDTDGSTVDAFCSRTHYSVSACQMSVKFVQYLFQLLNLLCSFTQIFTH